MSIIYEERASSLPYVDTILLGRTVSNGSSIRPAENGWHMVFVKLLGRMQPLLNDRIRGAS